MEAGAGLFEAQIGKRVSYPPLGKDHYVSNSEMSNFPSSKAAQGFSVKCTQGTSQPESLGERRSVEKGPFLDGHQVRPLAVSQRSCGVEEYI